MEAAYVGSLEFLRTHQGLLVRGQVCASIPSICSRCLNEFSGPRQLEIEEEFYPQVDVNTGRRLDIPADDEGTSIDANHVLDLAEVVRQYTLAVQPIKPICQTDCRGLCQECGADLNLKNCECSEAAMDPRWGALVAMLDQTEG